MNDKKSFDINRKSAKGASRARSTNRTSSGAESSDGRPRRKTGVKKKSGAATKEETERSRIGLPGSEQFPTGANESWRRIQAARAPAFDQAVPAYLLDRNYFFLDWNAAFDELVAIPLGLRRMYNHAEDFVSKLSNFYAVYERSKKTFAPGREPLIDIEPLIFAGNDKYGQIEFEKIAVQIADTNAELVAWSVYLNIVAADKLDQVWKDIKDRLENELQWSRYALSYDRLLLNFDDNRKLISKIVEKLPQCKRCLDLGAGTGNATLRLLETRVDREVWSIESNHMMLEQLISKVEVWADTTKRSQDVLGRLTTIKADLRRLDVWRKLMGGGQFDAAILINVLYTLADGEKQPLLDEVFRLLSSGGVLVLTSPHSETDVDKLFTSIRTDLESRKVFEQLKSNFDDARQRHRQMDKAIHRDSRAKIRKYVEDAGFQITDWSDSEYADAVVLVEAVKP